MQSCGLSRHGHAAAFESIEHRHNLGDRHRGLRGVEHDQVRGIPPGNRALFTTSSMRDFSSSSRRSANRVCREWDVVALPFKTTFTVPHVLTVRSTAIRRRPASRLSVSDR